MSPVALGSNIHSIACTEKGKRVPRIACTFARLLVVSLGALSGVRAPRSAPAAVADNDLARDGTDEPRVRNDCGSPCSATVERGLSLARVRAAALGAAVAVTVDPSRMSEDEDDSGASEADVSPPIRPSGPDEVEEEYS